MSKLYEAKVDINAILSLSDIAQAIADAPIRGTELVDFVMALESEIGDYSFTVVAAAALAQTVKSDAESTLKSAAKTLVQLSVEGGEEIPPDTLEALTEDRRIHTEVFKRCEEISDNLRIIHDLLIGTGTISKKYEKYF